MTDRYSHVYVNDEVSEIVDNFSGDSLTAEEITDILNRLTHQRQEDINDTAVIAVKYKNLQDENKRFKDTLIEAIHSERTVMGSSVLKNLADNLGVDYGL